jgi:hypothetical protein
MNIAHIAIRTQAPRDALIPGILRGGSPAVHSPHSSNACSAVVGGFASPD